MSHWFDPWPVLGQSGDSQGTVPDYSKARLFIWALNSTFNNKLIRQLTLITMKVAFVFMLQL